MQEKTTAKDVTGSLNGGYWMLDFIEFRAGQKQPMATYPFTERFLEQGAVLLLETNSMARRNASNNSKERLAGKVLS